MAFAHLNGVIITSIIPALTPRCQQLHRFQFLVRLHEEINALLTLSLIQMLRESIDVGVSEFFAWFQVWRAFQNRNNFFWQFVAWILAGHSGFSVVAAMTVCARLPRVRLSTPCQHP